MLKHNWCASFTHILYRITHILYPVYFRDSFIDSFDTVSIAKPILLTKEKTGAHNIANVFICKSRNMKSKKNSRMKVLQVLEVVVWVLMLVFIISMIFIFQ